MAQLVTIKTPKRGPDNNSTAICCDIYIYRYIYIYMLLCSISGRLFSGSRMRRFLPQRRTIKKDKQRVFPRREVGNRENILRNRSTPSRTHRRGPFLNASFSDVFGPLQHNPKIHKTPIFTASRDHFTVFWAPPSTTIFQGHKKITKEVSFVRKGGALFFFLKNSETPVFVVFLARTLKTALCLCAILSKKRLQKTLALGPAHEKSRTLY